MHFAEVSNNSRISQINLFELVTGFIREKREYSFLSVEILITAPFFIKIYRRFTKRAMQKWSLLKMTKLRTFFKIHLSTWWGSKTFRSESNYCSRLVQNAQIKSWGDKSLLELKLNTSGWNNYKPLIIYESFIPIFLKALPSLGTCISGKTCFANFLCISANELRLNWSYQFWQK